MSRKFVLMLLSAALFVPATGCALKQAPYKNAWPHYTVIVWRFKTPPLGETLAKSTESAGIRAVELDGSKNGVDPKAIEFVQKFDFASYLDHAASKGFLHLVPPDVDKVKGQLEPVARPHCLSDPATIQAMEDIIKKNVEPAKPTKCVGYAFDDEISLVSFSTPCDTCISPWCLPKFRRFLGKTYGSVASLNKQWGSDYKSIDDISIVGAEATRLANHPKPLNQWNLSGWIDSREFMDDVFADCLKTLTGYTNKLDPTRPAGYVGSGGPTAYGGYDYEKVCKSIQWIEAYDIGGTDAIIRSLMPNYPRVQTWFDNGSVEKNKWFNWYYWAQGDRGQIIWPATKEVTPWFEPNQARPDIQALKPMLDETQGPKLGTMLMDASYATDGIALYYSQPSIRVSWFIDIIPHGKTWPNRSSSYNNGNDTSHWYRYGWMKLLDDCGFSYNYVSPSQIEAGDLLTKHYKVLILDRTLALSDAEARAIKMFVAAGGHVIADNLCGVFDQHGKARLKGALDDVFGVSHDLPAGLMNGKVLYEIDAEKFGEAPLEQKISTAYDGAPTYQHLVVCERGLKATKGKPAAAPDGIPVVVKHGRAVYLNLSPVIYCIDRYNPKTATWPGLITGLLADASVKPRAAVTNAATGATEPITQMLYWKLANGRTSLILVKNLFRSAQINAAGQTQGTLSGEPAPIKIQFAKPVKNLKNERTGRVLGDGEQFEDTWVTCEANVYSFK